MNLKEKLKNEIENIDNRIVEIRHELHHNPELSGEERETNLLLRSIFDVEGIPYKTFKNHYGLVADIIKDPALPTVAIRGDMDALPMPENSDKPYASTKEGFVFSGVLFYRRGEDDYLRLQLVNSDNVETQNTVCYSQFCREMTEVINKEFSDHNRGER